MPHEYVAENFLHHGLRVQIIQDTDAQNPRKDGDNLGAIASWDRSYDLWDGQIDRYSQWDFLLGLAERFKPDMAEYLDSHPMLEALREDLLWKFLLEHYVILGISFHDYGSGGCRIRIDSDLREPRSGWIYCTKANAVKECGTVENAEQSLRGEIETLNQYLEGDVWGYVISEPAEDEDDEEPGDQLDSCWGFYGQDYCMEEAKSEAESLAKSRAQADTEYLNYCAL